MRSRLRSCVRRYPPGCVCVSLLCVCVAWVRCARRYPAASSVGAGAFALACFGIRCMMATILVVIVIDQPALHKPGGSHLKKMSAGAQSDFEAWNSTLLLNQTNITGIRKRLHWPKLHGPEHFQRNCQNAASEPIGKCQLHLKEKQRCKS